MLVLDAVEVVKYPYFVMITNCLSTPEARCLRSFENLRFNKQYHFLFCSVRLKLTDHSIVFKIDIDYIHSISCSQQSVRLSSAFIICFYGTLPCIYARWPTTIKPSSSV